MTPDIGYWARLQSTFGVDVESMSATALRSSLRDLLTELERVNGHLDSYRADNERLAWDNSSSRTQTHNPMATDPRFIARSQPCM